MGDPLDFPENSHNLRAHCGTTCFDRSSPQLPENPFIYESWPASLGRDSYGDF